MAIEQSSLSMQGGQVLDKFHAVRNYVNRQIIGQQNLVHRLLICLLTNGHLLVEGPPGLAKTRAVKVLASCIEGDFHRVQFTPDLLPADLTGTEIFKPQEARFEFEPGPLFHNLILADEVNRAPAKVQAALLEAMAERQITVGKISHPLPPLFMVMATQNPIEQEGTYPLPEAQLDRFLLHTVVHYPGVEHEQAIVELARQEAIQDTVGEHQNLPVLLAQNELARARREILNTYMSQALQRYVVELVLSTRQPEKIGEQFTSWINYGASPRATIALDTCSRAAAWLAGRDYVTPEDIQELLPDVLRHRVLMSFEAEADGISVDRFTQELLQRVAVP